MDGWLFLNHHFFCTYYNDVLGKELVAVVCRKFTYRATYTRR